MFCVNRNIVSKRMIFSTSEILDSSFHSWCRKAFHESNNHFGSWSFLNIQYIIVAWHILWNCLTVFFGRPITYLRNILRDSLLCFSSRTNCIILFFSITWPADEQKAFHSIVKWNISAFWNFVWVSSDLHLRPFVFQINAYLFMKLHIT